MKFKSDLLKFYNIKFFLKMTKFKYRKEVIKSSYTHVMLYIPLLYSQQLKGSCNSQQICFQNLEGNF